MRYKERLYYIFFEKNHFIPFLVLFIYLLFNIDFITGRTLPKGDTAAISQYFQHVYQEYFYYGRYPEWNPFLQYGTPLDIYNLIYISPFMMVSMVLGRLFGITDSWYMLQFLIFAEMTVFIFALRLLLGLFFRNRYAVFISMAAVVLTMTLVDNLWTSLRPIYIMPIALYFMFRSFMDKRLYFFFIASILAMIGTLGMPPYWVPMYALLYSLTAVLLFLTHRREIKLGLSLSPKNAFFFIVAVVYASCIAYLYLDSLNGIISMAPGRDRGMMVSKHIFLDWGGSAFPGTLSGFMGELSGFFLSAVGFFFLFYSIFYVKNPSATVFKWLLVVFYLIGWGKYSPVAHLVYYFPGMPLFRHLGLIFSFSNLFGAVLIGFGVERFVSESKSGRTDDAGRLLIAYIMCVLTLTFMKYPELMVDLPGVISTLIADPLNAPFERGFVVDLNFFILVLLLLTVRVKTRSFLRLAALLLVFQAGVYFFQMSYRTHESVIDLTEEGLTEVEKGAFPESRIPNQSFRIFRGNKWYELAKRDEAFNYWLKGAEATKALANVDFCVPFRDDRVNYALTDTVDFAKAMGVAFNYGDMMNIKDIDDPFFIAVGCNSSKLQLIDRYEELKLKGGEGIYLKDMIKEGIFLQDAKTKAAAVIRFKPGRWRAGTLAEQGISVGGFSSNHLEIDLTVSSPSGAWLRYADAYHRYWRAYIDSVPVEIFKADMAFKAIKLPYGKHRVRFEFGSPIIRAIFMFLNLSGALTTIFCVFLYPVYADKGRLKEGI